MKSILIVTMLIVTKGCFQPAKIHERHFYDSVNDCEAQATHINKSMSPLWAVCFAGTKQVKE